MTDRDTDTETGAAAFTMEQELEKMRKESLCSLCLDFYRDPVTVECGHMFCRPCILQQGASESGTASCPQCGVQLARGILRDNRFAASMVASVRRLVDGRERGGRGDRAGLGSQGMGSLCPEHSETLKLFCRDHQRAICLVCAKSEAHQNHTVRPMKEAAESYRGKLQEAMVSREKELEAIRIAEDKDVKSLQRLKERVCKLRTRIEAEFNEMQQFLTSEKTTLIARLDEKEKNTNKEVEENRKRLSDQSTLINKEKLDIQQRLSMQEEELLLQNITPIIERSGGEGGGVSSVSVDLTLGEFNRPLQYFVWKRMFKVLKPVPASLTLDARTANTNLHLFNNGTQMIFRRGLPRAINSPERFTHWPSALCSEGFTAGRHYWEVEVENNSTWRLGVVRESVPRNKDCDLEPATGFWTIVSHVLNGQFVAMSAPPTPLNAEMGLKKVGIYLDYEGGQLSFYNAEDMSHLYTFTDTFSEKLYPILSSACAKKALKIITD